MPLLGFLSIFLQVCFGVHAVKTGRERWLFVIIFFSLIGCAIYFFVEVLPDLQTHPAARKTAAGLINIADPHRNLRYLKDQVEISDSIKNRKALAEGLVNAGMFDDAISLYKTCLDGMYEDDPAIWEGLSCAYFFKEDFDEARKSLLKLREIRDGELTNEFRLLWARTLEASGDIEESLREYDMLARQYTGEEARCRYGLLLKKLGKTSEANEIFSEIIKNARLSPRYYRKVQKQWIDIAKKELRV